MDRGCLWTPSPTLPTRGWGLSLTIFILTLGRGQLGYRARFTNPGWPGSAAMVAESD